MATPLYRVLFIGPDLASAWDDLFVDWRQLGEVEAKDFVEYLIPVSNISKDQLDIIRPAILRELLSANTLISEMKSDQGDVQLRPVATDDPRLGLQSQQRLVTNKLYKMGDLVGIYGMWLGLEEEFFCLLSEYLGAEGRNVEQAIDLYRYAMAIQTKASKSILKGTGANPLFSTSMRYINDGRRDPTQSLTDWAFTSNVSFAEVAWRDMIPLVLVVATCDIPSGEELIADYGEMYWNALIQNVSALNQWQLHCV